ncbi:hypothetical protein AKJ09_07093 [Labilithrix luteola]|uniref:Uncharacterized protein n=1 Tax=Labilithrix luteola TaxID=1391654 RepID=A0A0K1Q4V0_9BACT|nr:hypothetical protein [Labilithrix luteola]AKV00430.1 hypothetical protein AKJ09_07093 [Labilithrix luteola]
MQPFEREDEGAYGRIPSERLRAFTKALWNALVPASGACASVQGELIRANDRLQGEYYREGMGNYYEPGTNANGGPQSTYACAPRALLVFVLDTLVENRGGGLDDDDVAFFQTTRLAVESDYRTRLRINELVYQEEIDGRELTDAEKTELERLESAEGRIPWEDVLKRAERCIANWCIANPKLVDRQGNAIEERGVADVSHIFEPPPPPPKCSRCAGRGWLPPPDRSSFPTMCSCT